MAGIINVVLKKNNKVGFNGNTSFTVGYPTRNNFTGLLNRRSDKLDLFASYSIMDRIGGLIRKVKNIYILLKILLVV